MPMPTNPLLLFHAMWLKISKSKYSQSLSEIKWEYCVRQTKHLLMLRKSFFFKLERKKTKKTEVKRTVLCDMHRLGNLFVCLEEVFCRLNGSEKVEVKYMVNRLYFQALEVAIHRYTALDSGMKASLKVSTYYLLKKLAKVVRSSRVSE